MRGSLPPTRCGIPWLGFVIHPTHRLLKRRNAVQFTRRFARLLDLYQRGAISFAELDASVQGWINHVRYADTWGLREHLFSAHPLRRAGAANGLIAEARLGGGRLPRTPSEAGDSELQRTEPPER